MICTDCAKAADLLEKVEDAMRTSPLWAASPILPVHPQDCDCTCQHRPPGSWKGKREDGSEDPE